MRHGDPQVVQLTVDATLTRRIQIALARRTAEFHDLRDAACVVRDMRTGHDIAYVGTLDFDSPDGGQFNAVRADMSPCA